MMPVTACARQHNDVITQKKHSALCFWDIRGWLQFFTRASQHKDMMLLCQVFSRKSSFPVQFKRNSRKGFLQRYTAEIYTSAFSHSHARYRNACALALHFSLTIPWVHLHRKRQRDVRSQWALLGGDRTVACGTLLTSFSLCVTHETLCASSCSVSASQWQTVCSEKQSACRRIAECIVAAPRRSERMIHDGKVVGCVETTQLRKSVTWIR